mmetsp:Transcript_14290/g.35510  ORF Transcript_14290/g.35510 Transcript_14290/m.35510 type:complete len:255 (+) Transcript_14290:6716-7480(+)
MADHVEEQRVILSEATGVAVPHGGCVAETLQHGVAIQHLLGHLERFNFVRPRAVGQIPHRDLRRLGLARARNSGDDHDLRLLIVQHLSIRRVRHAVRMWRQLQGHATRSGLFHSPYAPMDARHLLLVRFFAIRRVQVVDRWGLRERVDGQQHFRGGGVNLALFVPQPQVLENGCLVEVRQSGTVVTRFERLLSSRVVLNTSVRCCPTTVITCHGPRFVVPNRLPSLERNVFVPGSVRRGPGGCCGFERILLGLF